MALDLAGAARDVGEAEQALKAYEDPNLATNTRQAVTQQWDPLLKRATGETRRMMSEFLPRFFQATNTGLAAGTTAADLDPMQKLTMQGRELGTMGGQLSAQTSYTDYLGGRMSDMADKALEAMKLGNSAAADKYSRAFQRYQTALQEDQVKKQLAAQARLIGIQEAQNRIRNIESNRPSNFGQGLTINVPDQTKTSNTWQRLTNIASPGINPFAAGMAYLGGDKGTASRLLRQSPQYQTAKYVTNRTPLGGMAWKAGKSLLSKFL